MKRFKTVLTIIFMFFLFLGIIISKSGIKKEYKTTEFLFDTTCSVTVYGKDAKNISKEAFALIEKIHNDTNFFSENSDVSKINNAKPGESVKISNFTCDIIARCLEISEKSGGAFDITIAPVSVLWDFKGSSPSLPDNKEIEIAKSLVDYTALTLDVENQRVTKTKDIKIDLGAAAKGYACDKAREIFEKNNISAIIDLGGNVVCTGKNPNTKDGIWRIGLQVPFEATGTFEKIIEISSGSVVTSGTYQRYFEIDKKNYHHIIDPETGYPKDASYNAVTIVTDSALLADCLSTACFVLGENKGKDLAEEYGAKIFYY